MAWSCFWVDAKDRRVKRVVLTPCQGPRNSSKPCSSGERRQGRFEQRVRLGARGGASFRAEVRNFRSIQGRLLSGIDNARQPRPSVSDA